MSFEDNWLHRWGEYIYNYWTILLGGIITILFAFVGILFSLNKPLWENRIHSNTLGWIVYLIIVILSGILIYGQIKKSEALSECEADNRELKSQNETEKQLLNEQIQGLNEQIQNLENQISTIHKNYTEIFNSHLAFLFERLNLNNKARISLYKYEKDKFFIIGRHSSNPTFKKVGRRFYPSEGLIKRAWDEGEFFDVQTLREYKDTETSQKGYLKEMQTLATINNETLKSMIMRSRSFYIKSIKGISGIDPCAIIVIESIDTNAFIKEDIDAILNEEEERKLVTFVEKIDWNFPELSNATKEGF